MDQKCLFKSWKHKKYLVKHLVHSIDEKNAKDILALLQNGGADPNIILKDKGVAPFHLVIGSSCEKFALEVTKLFLRFGGDPNIKSAYGFTPLHIAAAWGRTDILHLLLLNGGDPWMQDDDHKTAFNYAFEEQKWKTVEMLHHFQLMNSAQTKTANTNIHLQSPCDYDLERIWVAGKNNVVIEYVPVDKLKVPTRLEENGQKSNYFRTYSVEKPSSPVKEIAEFFENQSKKETELSSPEPKPKSWLKDTYQTTCTVMVHQEPADDTGTPSTENESPAVNTVKKNLLPKFKETIPPPPLVKKSFSFPQQKPKGSPKKNSNLRSQLFEELHQVFAAKSKGNLSDATHISSDKYVTSVSGINLMDSKLLQHMSDFADKVIEERKEAEDSIMTEDNSFSQKAHTNSSLMTEESLNNDDWCKNVRTEDSFNLQLIPGTSKILQDSQDTENTPESLLKDSQFIRSEYLSCDSKLEAGLVSVDDTFLSCVGATHVCEEYKYTDREEDVVLLEQRHPPSNNNSIKESLDCKGSSLSLGSTQTNGSLSSVPSSFEYDTDSLRHELVESGYQPGPIMKTTKRLYLKKLFRIKQNNDEALPVNNRPLFSVELEKTLRTTTNFEEIIRLASLEEDMKESFNQVNRRWREGTCKASFNYLLLDPRVTQNLPRRVDSMSVLDQWQCFLSAVFYVGKGKRSRPYSHLYEAVSCLKRNQMDTDNKKIEHILSIWRENLGIVCLHIFHNIIPAESYTREAAIIDAIGRNNLKNLRIGDYYGVAATWSMKTKRKLGVYLLYRAMHIFLNEGERQIKPADIE